jgi:putative intracellular protease/amidase
MHRLVVLALSKVVPLDIAIPAQVFGTYEQTPYAFAVCGEAAGPVRTSAGFEIVAQAGPEALATADTVIVPGFEPHLRVPDEPVLEALRAAHARGARMVSICTGAFALAAAGVLDSRRATTHWRDAAALAARHPKVAVEPGVLYIDEGQVLTSAGVAAGLDLCLHILRRDHGAALANTIARRIVVPPHREGGQAQYVEQPVPETPGGSLRTPTSPSARSPAASAPRRARRCCAGCSPSASRPRAPRSRPPTRRSTTSRTAAASARLRTCASTSTAPSGPRRLPTVVRLHDEPLRTGRQLTCYSTSKSLRSG